MGRKAAETTHINNAFGQGTAIEHTAQGWFKKFCKGDESLEDDEHGGWPSEIDNDESKRIIEADPLKTTQEAVEELNLDHSVVIWHLKQTVKLKKSIRGCLWADHKSKNCHFEMSSSLLPCNNNKPFLNWIVTGDNQLILYDNQWWPAMRLDWEEAPKHSRKPKLHQKKATVTVWWSAAIHYSSLNPGETITSNEYAQQIN